MAEFMSPNVGNYQIAKGNVYFTPTGGTKRHMGNAPSVTFQIEAEKLDHFSSMAGIKKKDFSPTVQTTGTLKLTLEEVTLENLQIALLGDAIVTDNSTDGDGDLSFHIGANESVTGLIEIVGSNDIGPKLTNIFFDVTLTPDDAVAFIGEDYTGLSITGDCLAQSIGGNKTAYGKTILQQSGT